MTHDSKYLKLSLVGVNVFQDQLIIKISENENHKIPISDITEISLIKGKKSFSLIDIFVVFNDSDPSRSMAPSDSYKLTIHLSNGEEYHKFIQDFDLSGLSHEIKSFNKEIK